MLGRNASRRWDAARTNSRRRAQERQSRRPPSKLSRTINQWWDRLLQVAETRSTSDQASYYRRGRTKHDYVWNTAGLAVWGTLFPVLTVVSTQFSGAEGAGMFSMAFTVATLMLYVGNYGVRTYQVSDLDEMESFAAYQIQRVMTCLIMLVAGIIYCLVRGYGHEMCLICGGAFVARAVDALADVYEGRLQQMDKLYLAGISVAVRSVLEVVSFTVLLFVTRSLPVASVGMAVVALATLVLLSVPLAYLETPASREPRLLEIGEIFIDCFPAMAATFMFALIEAMPKFAMEGTLPYDNQVYFNAIYFPAQSILMMVGFVYRPQLVRLAELWADSTKRARFDVIVLAMCGVCVGATLVMLAAFATVGIPLNGILYATDFEPFREAQYIMIIAGVCLPLSSSYSNCSRCCESRREQRAPTLSPLCLSPLRPWHWFGPKAL